MDPYRYKAFISYRHQSPDQDIAQKLHKDIESFGIPVSLKKSLGITKMGRVFRDQEELTLSTDLGEDIHAALEQSEWLICICSPRYLQSRWCLEEVRYFLSLGRRDRILTVLTEGEPEASFPEELCFKEEDGRKVAVEPLAADVRADSVQAALKKLSGEKLRILAPMLGVSYDDLKQRAKQRRNRILAGAAAALILALSGFLGYAFHKNAQITAERNDALIAESKWLAQSANEALDGGDRMLSLLLSLAALPEDFDRPERPVTEEALESLRSAIISGQGDSVYGEVTRIQVPGLEVWRAKDNLLYTFSRQTDGCISIYDMNTGEKLTQDGILEEEPAQCLFSENLGGYLIFPDRIEDLNGIDLSQFADQVRFVDRDPYFEWSEEPDYDLCETESSYLLLQKNKGVFSGYMRMHNTAYRTYEEEGIRLEAAAAAGTDNEFLLAGYHAVGGDETAPAILRVDTYHSYENEVNNVIFRYLADTYVKQIEVSRDGSLIAGYREGALLFWNAAAEEPALVFDMEKLEGAKILSVQFSGRETSLCAILCDNSYVYLYDCARDEIRRIIPPGLYRVTALMWNAEGTELLLTCSDDAARVVSTENGDVIQTLVCPSVLKRAAYGQEDNNGNSTNDTFVLLEGDGEICVFQLREQGEDVPLMTRLNDKLSVMSTVSDNTYRIAIAKDGERIWNYHGDGLHVYDARTGEVLKVIDGEDIASTLLPTEQWMISYRSRDDYRATPAEEAVRIYDAETLEPVQKLQFTYPHVSIYVPSSGDPRETAIEEGMILSDVFLNEDASLLFAVGRSAEAYPCLFVFRTDSWEECWHIGLDWGLPTDRLFDFAADWPGYIALDADLMHGRGKILCVYTYSDNPERNFDSIRQNARTDYSHQLSGAGFEEKFSCRIAAEVRDPQTGEVLQTYGLPYTVLLFYEEPEYGLLIAQDAEYNVHILKAESGEEIALCEADSRIFDYSLSDTELKIRYELFGTMESVAPQGHVVSLSGEVTRVSAPELDMPVPHDGYYGDVPFAAASDGLYDAETGAALIHWDEGRYHYLTSWEDGRGVLLFAPFKATSTTAVDGDVVILRWAEGARLREIARQMLGSRELSEEQKQQYFLK